MGLDTSHDCWHGPYSSFNNWRRAICKAAGISFNREGFTADQLLGKWDTEPHDILDVLIEHHDCEGVIEHKHCAPLADRLEGLLNELPGGEVPQYGPHAQTILFINGLRNAHELGDHVEFR